MNKWWKGSDVRLQQKTQSIMWQLMCGAFSRWAELQLFTSSSCGTRGVTWLQLTVSSQQRQRRLTAREEEWETAREKRREEKCRVSTTMTLRDELLKSIWHAFTALDVDKSGKVSKSQLKVKVYSSSSGSLFLPSRKPSNLPQRFISFGKCKNKTKQNKTPELVSSSSELHGKTRSVKRQQRRTCLTD